MNLIKKNSLQNWRQKLQEIALRFPLTLVYIVASTLSLMYVQHHWMDGRAFSGLAFFLSFYPVSAAMLSLMLHLCTEESTGRLRRWLLQGGVQGVWLAMAVYWAVQYPLSYGQTIACSVCCAALFIGVFTLPFVKEANDTPAINFLIKLVGSIILAGLTSIALFLGLLLLIQSLNFLFEVSITESTYVNVVIFCFVFVAPLLVLIQLPGGEQKYAQHNWLNHKFGNGVIHFLLIPLHAVYLLILYLYLFKIVAIWQLPNGWVSWLVSALMLLTVAISFLLYPVQHQENAKRIDKLVVRYLPIVVLPLLALMTIGIVRRFSDYGVTVLRLYILLFNLWCYAVCIGLWLCRSRRVMWIATSFGAIVVLVSVFPYNISSVTEQLLRRSIRQTLAELRVNKLPIDKKQYDGLIRSAGPEKALSIDGKFDYLRNTYGDASTADLFTDRTEPFGYELPYMYDDENGQLKEESMKVISLFSENQSDTPAITIPKGYGRVIPSVGLGEERDLKIIRDTLYMTQGYTIGAKKETDHYRIALADLEKMEQDKKATCLQLQGEKTLYVFTRFYLNYDSEWASLDDSGTLFVK